MTRQLRFLVDESCDSNITAALRSTGHDVVAAAESFPGAPDSRIFTCAHEENRILVSEDKDFGEWIFGRLHPSPGVLLIRFPGIARASMRAAVLDLVAMRGEKLSGVFTVLEPGRARSRKA